MSETFKSPFMFRYLHIMLWIIPIMTLLSAYIAICFYADSLWPWLKIVHESGDRTLLDTILYYEHAARELPLDIVLGVAVGASVFYVFPESNNISSVKILRKPCLFAVGTLVIISIILMGTFITGGYEMLSNNLLQMHTRPGEALNWGSHWRYHLLSRLTLILFSLGFAGILLFLLKGINSNGEPIGIKIFMFAIVVFVILSIVFIPDSKPLFNAVFLGHQVREVFTHIFVTVPLAWAVCIQQSQHHRPVKLIRGASIKCWPTIAGISGTLLGLYLLVAALNSSSASQGQTDNLILLICPHFFEHSFSYFVVPLVAGLTFHLALHKQQLQ